MVRRRGDTAQHNAYDSARIETGMKIKVTFVIVLSLESNRHDYTSPDLEYRTVLPGRNKHNTA